MNRVTMVKVEYDNKKMVIHQNSMGQNHGRTVVYNLSNKQKDISHFHKGVNIGAVKTFKNNQLVESKYRKNNTVTGKHEEFYFGGGVKSRCWYNNGVKEGRETFFSRDGEVTSMVWYSNGVITRKKDTFNKMRTCY